MTSKAFVGSGPTACGNGLEGPLLRSTRPCHASQASFQPPLAQAGHRQASHAHPQAYEGACRLVSSSKPGVSSKPGLSSKSGALASEGVGRRRAGGTAQRNLLGSSSHAPRAAAVAAPVSSSHGVPQSHSSRGGRGQDARGRAAEASQDSTSGSGSERGMPPACMFVGPLEAADQSTLEEFYRQAKDSYYSGTPLILDEMFDRVEVHLRWLRSPVVQKYPRCSLQKNTTYADAEDDPSQLAALYGVWASLLTIGGFLAAGPTLYTADMVWEHSHLEDVVLGIAAMPGPMLTTTWLMLCAISTGLGLSLASASWSALKGLRGGGLVALRGVCPSCTEEVYAFVKVDGRDKRPRHKTDCHVCGQRLVFHAILRQSENGHTTGTPSLAGSSHHSDSILFQEHSHRDESSGGPFSSLSAPGGRGTCSGDTSSSRRGDTRRSTSSSNTGNSTSSSSSASSNTSRSSSSSTNSSGTPVAATWLARAPLRWVYGRVYAVAKPEDLRPR